MANKKQKLVAFLDQQIFDPVLHASARGKTDREKQQLEDLQARTRTEKDRYHHYEDAAKVKRMFKGDLSSAPAKRVHRVSHALGLPALPDVRQEFDALCQRLGI